MLYTNSFVSTLRFSDWSLPEIRWAIEKVSSVKLSGAVEGSDRAKQLADDER